MGWFADRKAKKKKREAEMTERSAHPAITRLKGTDDPIRVYDEYGNREDPIMEAVVGAAFATGQMATWTVDEGIVLHDACSSVDPAPSAPADENVHCPPETHTQTDHTSSCEPSSYSGGDSGSGGGFSGGE